MGLLSKKYEFYSEFSQDDFLKILEMKTDNKSFKLYIGGGLASDSKMFTGEIRKESFEIIRNFQLFNSFRPTIFGTFREENRVLCVSLKIKIKPLILIILASLMLFFNLMFISISQLKAVFFENAASDNSVWILLLIDLIVIAVIFFSFEIEQRMAVKDMIKIFKFKSH